MNITRNNESYSHGILKEYIYQFIIKNNKNIISSTKEELLKNRRADLFFEKESGEKIVVEIQNSYISPKELKSRTTDYNQNGYYVLWILNGKGKCCASHKLPYDKKETKINSLEKVLHKIYGGRVYYININNNQNLFGNKISLTTPFALHFSLPDKKKRHKSFYENHRYYFIRNIYAAKIPNWKIYCENFNNLLLARFYDKNIVTILKERIAKFYYSNLNNNKKIKSSNYYHNKIIKRIKKTFSATYGKHITLNALSKFLNSLKCK